MQIETKEYLLVFSRQNEKWWHRLMGGYNHCAIYDMREEVILEPLLNKLSIYGGMSKLFFIEHIRPEFKILHVKVRSIPKSRLIGIKPQTCASFIQYVVGIDLGTILCQKMYDILTSSKTSYLRKKGILEVKSWEPSEQV